MSIATPVSTRQRLADSLAQSLRWTALHQEGVGSGSECLGFILCEKRQHNDADLRPLALDAPRGLQTVHPLHPDVHHYGIGALLCHQLQALLPVCRFADTGYVGPKGEQGLQALTHHAPIIYN